jgi:hypothetical protein
MSVMIGMPCYGGNVSDKTTTGLFKLGKMFVRSGIDHSLLTTANESLITQGRSKIANFFINNTEFEYLLFLDSDVGFEPEDVLKLLEHNKELVVGAYPMKTVPLQWNFNLSEPRQMDGHLAAIDSIGLGFALIHRSVFLKVTEKYGNELHYIPSDKSIGHKTTKEEFENSYHFFKEEKVNGHYLAEDISFFHRVRQCKIQPWLDTSIKLCHVGSHVFQED